MKLILLIAMPLILISCINNVSKFYKPVIKQETLANMQLLKQSEKPEISEVAHQHAKQNLDSLLAKQYNMIGHSSFNGLVPDLNVFLDNIKFKAKEIGATKVIYSINYRDSGRSDFNVIFLSKSNEKLRIGIRPADLSTEQKKSLERNTGVYLPIIVEDTPAYFANVIAGDVLIEVNGTAIKYLKHLKLLLENKYSNTKSFTFKVIRNNKEKTIKFEI